MPWLRDVKRGISAALPGHCSRRTRGLRYRCVGPAQLLGGRHSGGDDLDYATMARVVDGVANALLTAAASRPGER
jgi:hypothetical protein